jgi:tRNA dimethylallyltransferase
MNKLLQKIVVLLGPTAVGKSDLACRLSLDYGFEIISADSLLVYKYLDIGTAKPAKNILKQFPHHLIDIVDPSEEFNAGKFNLMTRLIIQKLQSSSKRILIVGGTYLYIKILTEGIIDDIDTDKEFRATLRKERCLYGDNYIHDKLKLVDPESSERINCKDYVRLERALEVFHITGVKISELQKKHSFNDKKYDVLKIGLDLEKDKLNKIIESRMADMLNKGLIQEVQNLLMVGYSKDMKPLKSIGYKEVVDYLSGTIDLDNMKKQIVINTKRLAKKQMTWLKRDKDIKWFNVPFDYNHIKKEIELFYDKES